MNCEKCGASFIPHLIKPLTICDNCADKLSDEISKTAEAMTDLTYPIKVLDEKLLRAKGLLFDLRRSHSDFPTILSVEGEIAQLEAAIKLLKENNQ